MRRGLFSLIILSGGQRLRWEEHLIGTIKRVKITLSKVYENDAGVDRLRGEFERYYKGVDLYGLNAFLKVGFPDGTVDKFVLLKSQEGGNVVVERTIDGALTRLSGKLKAQIVLEDVSGDIVVNSAPFDIVINESVADETNTYTVIPSAVMELQHELQGEINDLEDVISEFETFIQGDFVNTVNGQSGDITLTKSSVGLGSVDNTADIDKPVSAATQSALNNKISKISVSNSTTLSELAGKGGVMSFHFGGDDALFTYQVIYTNGVYRFEIEALFSKFRVYGETSSDLTLLQAMSETYQDDYALESDLIDGLEEKQDLIDGDNKLGADLVDDASSRHKFVSASEKAQIADVVNKVPNSRTVNGHALSDDVTLTKTDLGLNNVDNTSDLNKPVSTATQTALDGKVPTSRTVNGHALSSDVTVTKSDIGLGNADNTSDLDKPISTATQAALNQKVNFIQIHPAIDTLSDIFNRSATGIIRLYTSDFYFVYGLMPIEGVEGIFSFEIESFSDKSRWTGVAPADTLFIDVIGDGSFEDNYVTESELSQELNDKQDVIDSSNKLSADFVDDSYTTNKFVTAAEKADIAAIPNKVPITRTIAGNALSGDVSSQDLTDNLVFCNNTTDMDYVMGDN